MSHRKWAIFWVCYVVGASWGFGYTFHRAKLPDVFLRTSAAIFGGAFWPLTLGVAIVPPPRDAA